MRQQEVGALCGSSSLPEHFIPSAERCRTRSMSEYICPHNRSATAWQHRMCGFLYNSAQILVRNKMIDNVAHRQEQACDKTLRLATDLATIVIGLEATACRICKSLQHKLDARQTQMELDQIKF